MKKLAFVGNTAFSMFVFRGKLMETLLNKGYDIYCISPEDQYTSKIKDLGIKFLPIELSRKGSNIFQDYAYYKALSEIYKQERFDGIFHYTIKPNIYGNFASSRAKTPSISFVTGLGYTFINSNITSWVAKRLYKFSLRLSEQVYFLNEQDMDLFTSQKLISSHKASIISGEGVDTERFNLDVKEWGGDKHFIYMGRLLIDKGINELLAAFSSIVQEHKNVYLHVVGDVDPNYRLSLTKEAFLNKIDAFPNIVYHGYQTDVLAFLDKAHFLILPSYREGLSTVTLEAMSCSRPVIGSDVPGINNVIEDKDNGFLFEPKSVDSIIMSVEKALSLDHNEYTNIAVKARKTITENYGIDSIIAFYEKNILPKLKNE